MHAHATEHGRVDRSWLRRLNGTVAEVAKTLECKPIANYLDPVSRG
jgi:hypothetical protein